MKQDCRPIERGRENGKEGEQYDMREWKEKGSEETGMTQSGIPGALRCMCSTCGNAGERGTRGAGGEGTRRVGLCTERGMRGAERGRMGKEGKITERG